MKKYFISGLIVFSSVIKLYGQTNETSIPFFETTPVIDGLPDTDLNAFQWKGFSYIEKSNEQNKDFSIRYKLIYSYTYLYLMIESDSDSIICRDRAYQNGDGFHMVIAKPEAGNKPADEFYVLRFSPENNTKKTPARKNVWYYNINLSAKPLSSATQFVCKSAAGKSYFELLLSWDDVHPYNPLFSDSIGINLCFVKAIGEKDKNYYYLKYDEKIQSELSKRVYLNASFTTPEASSHTFSLARLEKRNMQAGEKVKIKIISFTQKSNLTNLYVSLRSQDSSVFSDLKKEIKLTAGINKNEFDLPAEHLAPDEYVVTWKSSDNSEGQTHLSILPKINYDNEKTVLDELKKNTTEGNYNTLLFMLQNIIKNYSKIKGYETAGSIRESILSYKRYISELKNKNDIIADKKGIFRRAFLSKTDNTLQPYTIKIPENYNRNLKYPLLVMLHGSGADDREILSGIPLSKNDFIEIAPFGRGTSNCYTVDSAQFDVKEAIDDVIKNYAVDTAKIIIAGFSMGGYGAYRIFYEYPKLFKGVVVFSGHPNLASKWIGNGYPDFLEDKYLTTFKNIPLFIYHSKNDMNCPYDLTESLVNKLIKIGAKVEFVTTQESGHGIIDKDNISKYYEWLSKFR